MTLTFQNFGQNFGQRLSRSVILLGVALELLGCPSSSNPQSMGPPKLQSGGLPTQVFSKDQGRIQYQTQCTACHNTDPKKPGSVGPEVFGSSKELLEARILRAQYPPGYLPKRKTHLMAPLPHLKTAIDSIFIYLNQD